MRIADTSLPGVTISMKTQVVEIDSLLPIFHLCEYRTVDPTFSDVVLKNTFYHCNAVEALVMWYRCAFIDSQ